MPRTPHRPRPIPILLVALCALSIAAGSSAGLEIDILYDHDADFSAYGSYRWATAPPNDSPVGRLIDEEIKTTVERELQKKGLEPATGDVEADLILTYHGMVEDDLLIEGVRYELAPHVVWTGAAPLSVTRSRRLGTLILDFADAGTEIVVWSGVVHGAASDTTKLRQKIGPALRKLLRRYPPTRE